METTKKTTAKKAPAKRSLAIAAETTETVAKKAPAKKVVAKKAVAAPEAEFVVAPAREEISKRAYLIWANRGFSHGDPNHDWIQAERELKRA